MASCGSAGLVVLFAAAGMGPTGSMQAKAHQAACDNEIDKEAERFEREKASRTAAAFAVRPIIHGDFRRIVSGSWRSPMHKYRPRRYAATAV
jgi:hypothetical protein